MKKFNQTEYKSEYAKENYDRIVIHLRKDECIGDMIKIAMANKRIISRTEYIKTAIESQLIKDGIDVDKTRDMLRRMKDMQIDDE